MKFSGGIILLHCTRDKNPYLQWDVQSDCTMLQHGVIAQCQVCDKKKGVGVDYISSNNEFGVCQTTSSKLIPSLAYSLVLFIGFTGSNGGLISLLACWSVCKVGILQGTRNKMQWTKAIPYYRDVWYFIGYSIKILITVSSI